MDQPARPFDLPQVGSEREIYLAAIKILDPSSRDAFLDQACEGQPALRARIERLIAARCGDQSNLLQRVVGSFQSPLDNGSGPTMTEATQKTGRMTDASPIDITKHPMIDRYKLLEEIGRGGMGTVYMAQQTEPVRRRVALKVINPGMNSREVLARFEAERQALALMDHPNIASVFDGGTTESKLPYFVMELVRGIPLTNFCKQKKLSINDRLSLFLDVCAAVQHAHQKGIIHRDLKPSNILVTMHDDRAVVKVIDFGVAKALNQDLTDKTLFTHFSSMIGTPLYMSPEQAQMSGLDVDTRSDIYSLGVILYELLTGTPPFDRETLAKIGFDRFRKLLQEMEPERPSSRVSTMRAAYASTIDDQRHLDVAALTSDLNRELDWIVVKALEKDRERRYESAKSLADDIARYLNNEPVEACPPSMRYRLRKHAQRHKGLLATLSAIAATLLIATGVSVFFAFQANQALAQTETERKNAVAAQRQSEANFEAALAAIDKLLEHASSPQLNEIPQSQPVRRKMIEDVLAFYATSAPHLGDSEQLRHRAAKTWRTLAGSAKSLDDIDQARKAYEEALSLASELIKGNPGNWAYRNTKIGILHDKGYFHLWERHEFDQARKCFEDALAEVNEVKSGRGEGRFVDANDWSLALCEINETLGLAHVAGAMGEREQRDRLTTESYRLAQESRFDLRHSRALMEVEMARIKQDSDPDSAAGHYQQAITEWSAIVKEDPTRMHYRYLFSTLDDAASFFRNRDPKLAEQYAARAVDLVEQQAVTYPSQGEYWQRLWDYLGTYITVLENSLTKAELAAKFKKYDKYLNHEPENRFFFDHRIRTQFRLGNHRQVLADMKKATTVNPDWATVINAPSPDRIAACPDAEFRREVVDLANDLVKKHPKSSTIRAQRSQLLLAMGRTEEAIEDLNFLVEQDHFSHYSAYQLALMSLAAGDVTRYRQVCKRMIETFQQSEDPSVQHFVAWTCALSPDALDDDQPAIHLAEQAVRSRPGNQQYLGGLGAMLYRVGEYQAAKERLSESLQETNHSEASPAYHHYFLAMTLQALGDHQAAETALQQASEVADSELSSSPAWNRKLTLELLRREAESRSARQNDDAGVDAKE